ncbi:Uncharacterized protein HSR122_0256 [Halapricum desulfuricans]|uniref:Uncharacterized protein n=1 Tax=Halapricum desulfuricans TaxID=2841257 RepID=A0A897N003_9EURY|nr:hypothetical protein [Halapricum desulfuricans]QSG07670.1 Uncharacterized protein HSR122_0256 [Halapricum desulfuricans]
MTDDFDRQPDVPGRSEPDDAPGNDAIDDTPTISCERCGRSWDLAYELDELAVGNQAVQQFALDHHRHTGHFPDGISTWQASCRQCPETVERLEESAARRWAETHARHTRHSVAIERGEQKVDVVTAPER